MKDIEILVKDNFVTIKYYDEEAKMSFGRDPSLHPTKEMVLEVLDFLLYLVKAKHKGNFKELRILKNKRIEYQSRIYNSELELLEVIHISDF